MKMRINKKILLLLPSAVIMNVVKRRYVTFIFKSYNSRPTIMRLYDLKTAPFSSTSDSFVIPASTPRKNYMKEDCGCDPRVLEILQKSDA
jgi:hypothetical protein